MGARTGAEFIGGLRDGREVWLGTERVKDVTTHPLFRPAIDSLARLYDLQHEAASRDVLTYRSPASGQPVGLSFLIPRTREDLVRRRRMIKTWADATYGMMGRSADFLNTMVMAWAAKSEYFAQQSPECAERVARYYDYCREHDVFLTHALIDPQVDRSKNRAEQDDPELCLGIVGENARGLIVRGAKMIATAAPFADEILVWPFPPTLTEAEARYALVFIVPVATPGLKIICRESFTKLGHAADYPLSGRFDEMDAVAVFDDVLVPWERVFLHGDARLVANLYVGTRVREMTAHQTSTRFLSKVEFVYGLLCQMADAIGVQNAPAVQEMLGEAATFIEIIKSSLLAAELPASVAAFDSPVGWDLEKYYRGARIPAPEKVRLFKPAWNLVGSDFGSRHLLYEIFDAGDPSMLMAGFHREFDKRACITRVQELVSATHSNR